jgi:hypothetical protein
MAAMDEKSALAVAAVRAVETADRARTLWRDDDRAWASRAAAQVVGAAGAPEAFVVRRAQLALERLADRTKLLPRVVRAWQWRPWVGVAIVALAFVLGIAGDRVGDTQRINVLAPPVLLLLLWNLVTYAVLAAGFVVRYGEASRMGPLRRTVAWLAGRRPGAHPSRRDAADPLPEALAELARQWTRQAAPLYAARAARILHLAAAALALGVLIGLFARGIAFEYRATWESTFLDASTVRTLLAVVYAPGLWLTGMPVPDLAQVEAMRTPASVNAALWLRLIGWTLAIVIIAPRLLLALANGALERYRASHLAVPQDEPYFRRLLRGLHDGPATATVVPYSFMPDETARANLEALLARALGGNATVTLAPAVTYGGEYAPAQAMPAGDRIVGLFNLAATPEAETHGAFLAALARAARAGEPPLVVIDEAAWRGRNGDDPARLDARRTLWRTLCSDHRCPALFVDLAAPDFAAAERALDAALAEPVR